MLWRFLADLGPGLITGAADDDPSGISTYSIAGAQFGFLPLWTALFTFPLMAAVQLMCARLGLVTGRGLAGVIRRRYPRWVLWLACGLLFTANTFNIAADLGGMGEAAALVTSIPAAVWTPTLTAMLIALLLWSSYRQIATALKWSTVTLFAYVIAAFFVKSEWGQILSATFLPRIALTREFAATLVAILGTTISPYLFFWQAAQEVEEERAMGRDLRHRQGATAGELRASRRDVFTGMFFSNLIMYFIIVTTAATLHRAGHTQIASAREAADALRPMAGAGAYWLFTIGLIGTGLLAVPVLAGSSAYAIAEAAAWRGSLEYQPRRARQFYVVLTLGMLVGLALNGLGYSAIHMLFWSAVLNGLLAPPLIVLVLLLTSDPSVMGRHTNSGAANVLGWLTAVAMTVATVIMFLL
jgi:NRAMP (natural resistance-associated macrophage protein)-like metal ion transporter